MFVVEACTWLYEEKMTRCVLVPNKDNSKQDLPLRWAARPIVVGSPTSYSSYVPPCVVKLSSIPLFLVLALPRFLAT